jgi:hypothetical protein
MSLEGLRDGLAKLSQIAFRSSPAADGWILQAQKDYSDTPPEAVIAAYGEIFKIPPPRWVAVP